MTGARISVTEGVEIDEVRTVGGEVVRPGLEVSISLDYAPGWGQHALAQLSHSLVMVRQAVEANP